MCSGVKAFIFQFSKCVFEVAAVIHTFSFSGHRCLYSQHVSGSSSWQHMNLIKDYKHEDKTFIVTVFRMQRDWQCRCCLVIYFVIFKGKNKLYCKRENFSIKSQGQMNYCLLYFLNRVLFLLGFGAISNNIFHVGGNELSLERLLY